MIHVIQVFAPSRRQAVRCPAILHCTRLSWALESTATEYCEPQQTVIESPLQEIPKLQFLGKGVLRKILLRIAWSFKILS